MKAFAAFPNTYMKLSGGVSGIEPLPSASELAEMDFWARHQAILEAADRVEAWLFAVLTIFGQHRVIFGSERPVCNIGGGGNPAGFNTWVSIMRSSISPLKSFELFSSLWGTTAAKVYKIRLGRLRQ